MSQFIRFVMVGVFNTLYGFAIIFACMYWFGLGTFVSNAIGYVCGLITSYVLNRVFTFKSEATGPGEAMRFLIVFVLAYVANLALLYACVHWGGIHAGLSQVIAGTAYVAASFLLNKFYVFRQRHPVGADARESSP